MSERAMYQASCKKSPNHKALDWKHAAIKAPLLSFHLILIDTTPSTRSAIESRNILEAVAVAALEGVVGEVGVVAPRDEHEAT